MRNIWKRAAAAVLALAMCLSFAGCYDENMTWAARKDDDTLPIGGYIYYLYSAYTEAASQVDSSTHVLDAQIDGEDAEQWIKDRALTYVQSYYYINDKMAEYGPGDDRRGPEPGGKCGKQPVVLLREHL